MRTAGTVVVGAGVIGASVAYHLASSGVRDILILERHARPGEEAPAPRRAATGPRSRRRSTCGSRCSRASHCAGSATKPAATRATSPPVISGSPPTEKDLDALRAALEVQHAEGLSEAALVDAGEIARLNPWAGEIPGLLGGLFCPTDGFVLPMGILEGYLAAASRLGARIEYGVTVTSIVRDGDATDPRETARSGRIIRIETTQGPIAVGTLVNAAGAWAAALAALAGIDLPVTPLRRQVAVTRAHTSIPPSMPMTIFAADGFHFRERDGRILLLWPGGPVGRPERADPFDARVDADWVAAVAQEARRRVPALGSIEIDSGACRAGLYEMSPDRHAILGAAPGCPNFYLANGSSGHGVMHAPALGRLLAEIVTLGQARSLDVSPLRPSRFSEGGVEGPGEVL
jgi:sarcosine oxidase subunit beta